LVIEREVKTNTRKILLSALFIALAVAMGYIKPPIPNVELFTATVFIAGFTTGRLYGISVGVIGEFIYSFYNPLGAAPFPTLMGQVSSMALVGFTGGVWRAIGWPYLKTIQRTVLTGLVGFFLTLVFDVLTTISYVIFIAGMDPAKLLASFVYGMTFYLIHLLANTIIFSTLVPVILTRLQKEIIRD
jgi:uncharacterized membrane protein